MGRISVDDVKINIEKAFDGWLNSLDDDELDDPENPGEEAQDLNASHANVVTFLRQVDAREALLRKAILACQAMAEVRTGDKEAIRARSLAREVISQYGEPGGMHAN